MPGPPGTRLLELPVLLLDAQATAASPERGALVEIGWARAPVSGALSPGEVAAHVVAPPPGAALPRAVARLTGIRRDEWERGEAPGQIWQRLLVAGNEVAPPPVPVVVHFARFEEPFLRALHERYGAGPFPLELVCTHAIARRLLPELPRRTLRALAGYFGAAVTPLRRSADHVVATARVWHELVRALERVGIEDLASLRRWLEQKAPRLARSFPLARDERRALPRGPGVYRFLRAGGTVVYVGKAACLRQRVSGHFHAPEGERALELLTQVRDVSCTETATALEAALLESDEIKRLAPVYNRALAGAGRSLWFATADLCCLRERPDEAHVVGPLPSLAVFETLAALRSALASDAPAPLALRAAALGLPAEYAPAPGTFAAGRALFVAEHGRVAGARDVLRDGARVWARRCAARDLEPGAPPTDPEPDSAAAAPRRFSWDAEAVREALEEAVLRAAHAVRRARWLVRLCECALAWSETGWVGPRRLITIERGAVVSRRELYPGETVPLPPGHGRSPGDRRTAFDVATFDRLRVLTTELRPLVGGASAIELRLGSHAWLSRRRLARVLRWV